jgi:hypothetical protein
MSVVVMSLSDPVSEGFAFFFFFSKCGCTPASASVDAHSLNEGFALLHKTQYGLTQPMNKVGSSITIVSMLVPEVANKSTTKL